jgi:hypothetical protein
VSASRKIEKLRGDHPIDDFDCGHEELNNYLNRYALQNQRSGGAQTYVGLADGVVIGFHTLTTLQ